MAAAEWVAYWGAGLSTALAIREVLKHRRATRPQLIGYLHKPTTGIYMIAKAPGQSEQQGQTQVVSLHNRGGAATSLHQFNLCIVRRWCPRMLLGLLGEFGWATLVDRDKALRIHVPDSTGNAEIAPGKDFDVRVVLWDEHRAALDRGRLMLSVVHTWARDRPQQVILKSMA
jgi:hypothetical protein